MSLTLTSSRGTTRSPSRGVRIGAALLAAVVAFGVTRIITTRGGDDATSVPVEATDPAVEIAELEQRIAADPDDADAWQRLAPFYLARAAGSGDRALVLQAEHAVDEAIRLRPDDIATYHAHGALELTLHQFAAAREVGLAAHASHPDSPDALAILVDSSIELGRYDDADMYLRELLDRRPNAAALARVSYLREIRGDLPGARVAMSQAETAASGERLGVGHDHDLGRRSRARRRRTVSGARRVRARRGAGSRSAPSPSSAWRVRSPPSIARTRRSTSSTASIDRFPEPALLTLLGELYEATGRTDEASAIYAADCGADRPPRRGRRGQQPRSGTLPRRPRRS